MHTTPSRERSELLRFEAARYNLERRTAASRPPGAAIHARAARARGAREPQPKCLGTLGASLPALKAHVTRASSALAYTGAHAEGVRWLCVTMVAVAHHLEAAATGARAKRPAAGTASPRSRWLTRSTVPVAPAAARVAAIAATQSAHSRCSDEPQLALRHERCNRDGAMFRMASKRVQQRTGAEYFTLGWSCRLQPTSTGLTCGVSHLHVGFNHELGPCHGCPWLVGACERRSKKIMYGGKNLPPRRRVLNWLQARSNYEQLATLTTTTNVFMALNSRWQPASRHAQVGRKEAHTQPEISLAAAVVASLTLAMPRRTTRRWLATARAVAHGHEHRAGFSWR